VVRQTTAKSRFARSLVAVKDWCRTNRHRPAPEQRAWLSAVLIGHYAYYGITGNIRRLQDYRYQVEWTWRKWLERRTRGIRSLIDATNGSLGTASKRSSPAIHCQLPRSYTATPDGTNLSREEPDA
jgi:hypothetical protein